MQRNNGATDRPDSFTRFPIFAQLRRISSCVVGDGVVAAGDRLPRRERSWRRQRLRPRAPPKILTMMHFKFLSFIKPGGDAVVEIRFWSLWGSNLKADPHMSCMNKKPIFSTKPAAISTGRARSKAKGSARLCSLQKTLVNHVVIAGDPFPRYEEARAKPISRCTQQPRVFSYPSRFPLSVNAFCRCCCSAQDSSWRW